MGGHRRKADGRRVVSTEFKRATVQRILTGEKTLAEQPRARHLAECDPKLDSAFIAKPALALSLGSRQIPITQGPITRVWLRKEAVQPPRIVYW
jgi:hypothetical protein